MASNATTKFWSAELEIETRHWMRWLTFRRWLVGANVIEFAGESSVGRRYAAQLVQTIDVADEGSSAWDQCDLFVSFEAPDAALAILPKTSGRAIIGARRSEGWSEDRLSASIRDAVDDRPFCVGSQSDEFPYSISDSTVGDLIIAVVGSESLPAWPSIGLAMPTVDSPKEVREAVLSIVRAYPGQVRFAIIANGSTEETRASLRETAEAFRDFVELIESPKNLGYGQGANRGMEHLLKTQNGLGFVGVVNDDVIADMDCLGEIVCAFENLESMGHRPGVIGPVSNYINGPQAVELTPFRDYRELQESIYRYRWENANSVTQSRQLRGLLMVMKPQLALEIGGFDPIFGIGNFEDDDHNLRTYLAGYSIWIADGAFLYHHGSTTFRRMNVDYEANIRRNAESMAAKWGLERAEQWIGLDEAPTGIELHVPLASWALEAQRFEVEINGETVDLVSQASDVEFAAWVISQLRCSGRSSRQTVIDALIAA